MLKKGAMFGLDARIALAIFGALSVISGAALYSAIGQAKAIAILAELREVEKAFEAYYVDTGEQVARNTSSSISFNMHHLVDQPSGVVGWKGPYLSYEKRVSGDVQKALIHPLYQDIKVIARSLNDAWGGTNGVDSVMPGGCSGSAEPCGLWMNLSGMTCSDSEAVDEYVDGELDYKNGKVRIYKNGTCLLYIAGSMTTDPS
jgi:hypothetical protein